MASSFTTLAFLDIGSGEMMMVLLLVLIFFGGDKLPEFARGLGKSIREFKKATAGVEEEIKRALAEPPPRPPVAPLPTTFPPRPPSTAGSQPPEAELTSSAEPPPASAALPAPLPADPAPPPADPAPPSANTSPV